MTLREESGNGSPTGPETGGRPPQSPAQPPEPPAQLQEPPAQVQEPAPPLEVPLPREPPPPEEAPSPLAAAPPEEAPQLKEVPPREEVLPPQEPPAGPAAPGGPVRTAGPADAGQGGPPRRRRSLAVLAVVCVVACLFGLGAFATVLLLHSRPHATPAALPSVFRLHTGECVDSGRGGISSPTVVLCGQPHDAEIYATFALAEHNWPGPAAIGVQARRGCTARLGSYLNPQLATSVLAESYVFPDQGAWNAGERTVICEIRSTAGKLTGSVRGLS